MAVQADLAIVASVVSGSLLDGLGCRDLLAARTACPALILAARGPLTTALAELVLSALGLGPSAQRRRAAALRCLACVAARAGGDRRAAELVARSLQDRGADVRRAAASAFAEFGSKGAAEGLDGKCAQIAIELLGPAIADCDERVSTAAARALPKLVARGDKAATSVVLRHLHNASPWVRRSALSVLADLGERGNAMVVSLVVRALRVDSDWRVRAAAARALASLAERGNVTAAGALQDSLKDPEAGVRQVAAGALAHVALLPSMPFLAIKAEKWRSPTHRRQKRQVSTTPGLPAARRNLVNAPVLRPQRRRHPCLPVFPSNLWSYIAYSRASV
ncbi:unnamed protein product [Polarella glacialis]|uniref:Uncharacterized protein n=1 Tax=Polarella glacialis TaxID=89957 RepID=A0A813JD54_POLGL|nr:unnamed protein product [Polarella glacialis]